MNYDAPWRWGTQRRVLIAEDEAIVAHDLRGRLTVMQFEVVAVVQSADEAVREAERTAPDIALLDISLKGAGDGIGAAQQIRARQDIPVVFSTASSDPQTFARAHAVKPQGFLFKPYEDHELRITLELALSQFAAERAIRQSEDRYKLLLETNLAGVFRLDQEATVQDTNPAFRSMFGLGSTPLPDHLPMLSLVADPDAGERFLRDLRSGGRLEAREIRLRHIDGTVFWGLANVVGSPDGHVIGTIIDITGKKEAEHTLARQRQFLHTLLDALPDQVYVKNQDHRYLFCNPALARLYGRSASEVIGKTDVDLSGAEVAAHCITTEVDVMSSGKARLNHEERQVDAAGTPRYVLASRVPMLDPDGAISGIIGINHDITAHKQYEAILQDDVRFQQTLLDAIPAPVFYCDASNRFVGCNTAFEYFFGQHRRSIMGMCLHEFLPRDHAATLALANEELLARRGSITFETVTVDGNGRERTGLTHQAVFEDAWGAMEGTVSVFIDLTEQQELRDALARSEQRYRNMFEDVNAVMFLIDPETGRIIDANGAASRFYGYDRATLTSMQIAQINVAPPEAILAGLDRARTGSQRTFTWKHRTASGEVRDVEVNSGPISVDGRDALFSIVTDITERRHAEEARRALDRELEYRNDELERLVAELRRTQDGLVQSEKLASIGQLTAGIAHEINNPLAFVISNLHRFAEYFDDTRALLDGWKALAVQLLATGATEDESGALRIMEGHEEDCDLPFITEDFHRLMQHATEGTARIRTIVDQLRGFTHVAADGFTEGSVNEAMEDTLMITWNELKYKATIHRDYGDIPPVTCNFGEIKQVFVNLLVNAAHAMQTQGEITIRTFRAQDRVSIQVSDTGCGIPQENLKRIFDPFFTTKPTGKGTGLGLWIAATLVQKHQGRISVDSEAGRGTTFTIELPVRQTDIRRAGP